MPYGHSRFRPAQSISRLQTAVVHLDYAWSYWRELMPSGCLPPMRSPLMSKSRWRLKPLSRIEQYFPGFHLDRTICRRDPSLPGLDSGSRLCASLADGRWLFLLAVTAGLLVFLGLGYPGGGAGAVCRRAGTIPGGWPDWDWCRRNVFPAWMPFPNARWRSGAVRRLNA